MARPGSPRVTASEPDPSSLLSALSDLLGPSGVVAGGDIGPYVVDERGEFTGAALAVARPATTAEVAAVVRLCSELGVAIVTQGGNSGLSGGSVPNTSQPTIILSTRRMTTIDDVNPEQFTITAQAGVTIEALQDAAREHQRLFAPDWGARGTATVGGALATNAGGINVLRYGTIREQVLGLEVVMADGRTWNGLRALPKDNSGYDLKQLFVGSEGTLGVITRATLRLRSRPADQHSAFVALGDIESLSSLFAATRQGVGAHLTAFELVPEVGLATAIDRYDIMRPLSERADWYVLLRVSGPAGTKHDTAQLLADFVERGWATDAVIAETTSHEENLWRLRDELTPPRLFDGYLVKYDLAVPIDRIGAFHAEVRQVVADIVPGAMAYAFGHVGDGNLHLTVWPAESSPGLLERRQPDLVSAIDDLIWRHGGTISAEHGVGQELRTRLVGQKPSIELELMARIKAELDPDHLLNPGKIFTTDGPPLR